MNTPDPNPDAEWWTTTDVARYLGLRPGTVSSYRDRGQMPAPDETEGRTHRWRPARIIAWQSGRPRPGVGGRPVVASPAEAPSSLAFLHVSTATETRQAAEMLARLAVEGRLAAGAQITGPVASAFWHLGEFGLGEEWRLVLQTHVDRYPELEKLLIENHPWEKPEIAAVAIVAGSDAYFEWLAKSIDLAEEG